MLNNAIDLTFFRIKFTTVGVIDYERWRKGNKFMSVSYVHYSQSTTFVCEKKIVCLKLVFVYRVSLVPQLISQFYYNFVTWQLVSGRIMDPHESTILFLPFTTCHVGKLWQKLWNLLW